MCTYCKTLIRQNQEITDALEDLRKSIEKAEEQDMLDNLYQGFDCCNPKVLKLQDKIIEALEILGIKN